MRHFMPLLMLTVCTTTTHADEATFTTGPVFTEFGPVAAVDATMSIPPGTVFRHSFDVATKAASGEPNSTLMSAARFINMHARDGIAADDIQVAVVVHGQAVFDVADNQSSSAALVAVLVENGVRIIVCGQSAAYRDISVDDLLPGVEMALSAMTAHAVLQQQGFTLNPF